MAAMDLEETDLSVVNGNRYLDGEEKDSREKKRSIKEGVREQTKKNGGEEPKEGDSTKVEPLQNSNAIGPCGACHRQALCPKPYYGHFRFRKWTSSFPEAGMI